MFKMNNTTLQAIIEIISEENYILVEQGDKLVLSAMNCFKLILSEDFANYKDCYVKNLKIKNNHVLLIQIETPEEREATKRIEEWEKEMEMKERQKENG